MASEILVVDDEADIRLLIAGILEDEGYATREAGDADKALAAIAQRRPSLVVLDVWLEGSRIDGIEILKRIKADHPDLPVVMISGHGTIEMAVAAIREGAYEFIEKPFNSDRLLLVVQRAIENSQLRRENAELKVRAPVGEDILGQSAAAAALRAAAKRVAATQSRVLIVGPPGAGKEVVARYIHTNSRQADGPFVVVNCATMAPERVEAELFGVEGSADGTVPRKVGYFEQAHGGTLLLDEVADMPLETQAKILRALQDQAFERVGGTTRVQVQVRVLASTNRDLLGEISAGRFREDLYYRLAVVPIEVPPLRQRRDDIPLLAEYFMDIASRAAGQPRRPLHEETHAVLQTYDWPGNVRQLRNVVAWLIVMAPGGSREPLTPAMLPPEVSSSAPSTAMLHERDEMIGLPLREARELFERQYLLAQVNRFGGNISRTATFVGMERSALHRKLKSLGVHLGPDRA